MKKVGGGRGYGGGYLVAAHPFQHNAVLGQGNNPEMPSWMLAVGTLIQGVVFAAIAPGLGL